MTNLTEWHKENARRHKCFRRGFQAFDRYVDIPWWNIRQRRNAWRWFNLWERAHHIHDERARQLAP